MLCVALLKEMPVLACFVMRVNGQVSYPHENSVFHLNSLNLVILVTIYYPQTRHLKQLFYFAHDFVGPELGLILAWDLSQGWSQGLAGVDPLKPPLGWMFQMAPSHGCGCQWMLAVGWELREDCWPKLLHTVSQARWSQGSQNSYMTPGDPRADIPGEAGGSWMAFSDLGLQVTQHPLCRALLVKAVARPPRFKKREYTPGLLLQGVEKHLRPFFKKLPHLPTHVFCLPASFSPWGSYFVAPPLCDSTLICFKDGRIVGSGSGSSLKGDHGISSCLEGISKEPFGEFFILILYWVTIFIFVIHQIHTLSISLYVHLLEDKL